MPAARPDPTPAEIRRHWLAAQRLADDDLPQQVALQAGLTLTTVRELVADADFQVARDAEAAILALDPAAWERRMEGMMRQAAERALVDGKVSTLNLLLRARLALPAVAAKVRSPGARAALQQAVAGLDDREADDDGVDEVDDEPDPDAWLADVPVVEADPSDESLRRSLLGMIEHAGLRAQVMHGPLKGIEQLIVASDPVAYEEWFAKQPKVPFEPMDLPDSIKADIEEVTKHNPPWMRGQYLGYYRPPVPAHLFDPNYVDEDAPAPALPAVVPPAPRDTIPELRDRVARLLDRGAPRLAEELDLAEAICAIKWPKWPDYRGAIDLGLLRRALLGTIIDGPTLNWLGGKEIVRECRASTDRRAQGP